MDRIKKLKVKKSDGSFTDYIPIGSDAEYIDMADGDNLQEEINTINNKLENQSLIFQKNERNSKYIGYIFCDNEYRQSIKYITELLTRYANARF